MTNNDKRTHIAQTRRALESELLDKQCKLADALDEGDCEKRFCLTGDIENLRGLIAALET